MKHKFYTSLIPILMAIGWLVAIPLTARSQNKPLKLDLKKGIGEMPELRSTAGGKLVTSIEYYTIDGELEGTARFEYSSSGRVSKMELDGNMGHMYDDKTWLYEVTGNGLALYELNGSQKELTRICKLDERGYIIQETNPDGSEPYNYTYDSSGQTVSATLDYGYRTESFSYQWTNGNISNPEEPNTYTDIPNKANLNLNALWREYYAEDTYGFALCGYIGNNDANLVATGEEEKYYEYKLDADGYPVEIWHYWSEGDDHPAIMKIHYGEATITDPEPTPDPDPTPGGDGEKVVTSIEYYETQWDEWQGTITFEYDNTGRVAKMQLDGYLKHIDEGTFSYEINGNEMTVYEIKGTRKEAVRVCRLNSDGYVVREADPDGDGAYSYTYEGEGEVVSGLFDYTDRWETIDYHWVNGNVYSSLEENSYSTIPNNLNININALWRQFYAEDRYGLALCGYIGHKDANLLARGEKATYDYDFDADGYPEVVYETYDGTDYYLVINYGKATITDPDPEPDPDPTPGGEDDPSLNHPTTDDELEEAIENAPEGTEENPTEIFIPSSGISLNNPIDIDKHIRLTGGTLTRGKGNPYALFRVREGYSLNLANITIDGGGTELLDGSLIVYGKLELEAGATLANCYRPEANVPSGAICVGPTGVVDMNRSSRIIGNTGAYGSAIYCEGEFNMYGGEISGNMGQIGTVAVNAGGIFRMYNGTIANNQIAEGCGGVFVSEDSQFRIFGGTISGNDHCDVYSWANIYTGGPAHIEGLVLLIEGSYLIITDGLEYDWTVAFDGYEPLPGTRIAIESGNTSHHLTASDLRHIRYADNAYDLELRGNEIVIADNATGIEGISGAKVYTEEGNICVYTPKQETVTIISMNGVTLQSGTQIGWKQYSGLQRGIYIIGIGNQLIKVRL